jgi:hypothetical protein
MTGLYGSHRLVKNSSNWGGQSIIGSTIGGVFATSNKRQAEFAYTHLIFRGNPLYAAQKSADHNVLCFRQPGRGIGLGRKGRKGPRAIGR